MSPSPSLDQLRVEQLVKQAEGLETAPDASQAGKPAETEETENGKSSFKYMYRTCTVIYYLFIIEAGDSITQEEDEGNTQSHAPTIKKLSKYTYTRTCTNVFCLHTFPLIMIHPHIALLLLIIHF